MFSEKTKITYQVIQFEMFSYATDNLTIKTDPVHNFLTLSYGANTLCTVTLSHGEQL